MDKALNLPAALRADADAVPRLSPVGRHRKTLVAGDDELDRSIDLFCSKRNQSRARRQLSLGAERAADKRADDMNSLGIDTERLRDAVLETVYELARLIDRQFAVAPTCRR